MSLPLLFQPVRYRGCLYVDPVVGRNFPFDYPNAPADDTGVLGLRVRREDSIQAGEVDLYTYLTRLFGTCMHQSNSHDCKFNFSMEDIVLTGSLADTFCLSTLEFLWTNELVDQLSRIGYTLAQQCLQVYPAAL